MKKLIAVLLVSVFALSACGGSAESVTNLGVNDFTQKIADPSVTLLDVRTPAEFAAGHIAGAINIDYESGEFKQDIQALDRLKLMPSIAVAVIVPVRQHQSWPRMVLVLYLTLMAELSTGLL